MLMIFLSNLLSVYCSFFIGVHVSPLLVPDYKNKNKNSLQIFFFSKSYVVHVFSPYAGVCGDVRESGSLKVIILVKLFVFIGKICGEWLGLWI